MTPRARRARTALPDVNVLLALAFEDHVHHVAASDWFVNQGRSSWATCSLTESGFVRLSSNPRLTDGAVTPEAAAAQLAAMVQEGSHSFWADTVSIASDVAIVAGLSSFRQVTDAHLLAVARANDGVLFTFDRGVGTLAHGDEVEVLRWQS